MTNSICKLAIDLETVTIRDATADDLPGIQALLFGIFQEPQFNESYKGHSLWDRMSAHYQADPTKNETDFWGTEKTRRHSVVIQEKTSPQTIVGMTWITASEHDNSVGELNKLYLRKDYRGLGLGCHVLQLMLEKARELKFSTVLITGRELTAAIDLYKRYGFLKVPQERYQNSPNSIAIELNL